MKHSNIIKILFASVILMSVAIACGNKANTPGDTAKKFSELIADGKIDKAMELIDGYQDATEEEKQKMTALFNEAAKELDKKEGIKSVEILEEEINEEGNKATVKVKTTYGNGDTEEETQTLVKKDGKWYMTMEK